MTEKVSVIIPVFNSSRFLAKAIESVLAQTYQNFEIILVDDGSTDNSKEIILSFLTKFPDKVSYLYQQNKGIAGARNTGLKNSSGVYIALLDADDRWLPTRLEESVIVLQNQPDIGLVHSDIVIIDENDTIIESPTRETRYLSGSIFEHLFLRKANISAVSVLFRRSCIVDVELFDEDPRCMGCDDRDLWLRISEKYHIVYIDKILSQYRIHSSNYSNNLEKMVSARYYIVSKYRKNKESSILIRKALAKIHRDFGDSLLYQHMYSKAKTEYVKALKYWPFSFWLWVNLFKSVIKFRQNFS